MDQSTPPSTGKRLTLKKRLLFGCLISIGLYLVSELCAWVAFGLIEKRPFSFARIHSEQQTPPEEILLPHASAESAHVVHPYLGYVCNPRKKLVHRSPISNYGFPDDDRPLPQRSPGKVIIGILGGSVAHHFTFSGQPVLEEELKKYPRFADKELIFVRLAMNAYKQPQQLMVLNYFLALGASFDILLNIDGFNEVAMPARHNVPIGVFPLFPKGWNLLVHDMPDSVSRAKIGKIAFLQRQRTNWRRSVTRGPLGYSATMSLVWKLRDRQLHRALVKETLALQGYRPEDQRCYSASGPACSYASEADLYGELTRTWRRCSEQLARLCRANDVAYYHFLQPNQYVAGSKPMSSEEQSVAVLADHPYRKPVEKGYPLLIQEGKELRRQGVRFVDLTLAFADFKDPLYYDSCCHFNQTGHEILAHAIAQTILETHEPPK